MKRNQIHDIGICLNSTYDLKCSQRQHLNPNVCHEILSDSFWDMPYHAYEQFSTQKLVHTQQNFKKKKRNGLVNVEI